MIPHAFDMRELRIKIEEKELEELKPVIEECSKLMYKAASEGKHSVTVSMFNCNRPVIHNYLINLGYVVHPRSNTLEINWY